MSASNPQKPVNDVITELGVDVKSGLSEDEVKKRVQQYGYNEIEEKKESSVKRLAKKFWGLTSWMLEITMVLTLVLHRYLDFYVVTALLLLNVILGFAQEQRASSALETLKQKLHVMTKVIRGGIWKSVSARELVPGDIIRVRAGDFVPADLRIIEGNVEVDQSALTGESLTVSKEKEDQVFSGSVIRRGEITGIVVGTGARTFFGKTTELVKIAKPKLHMEEVISQVVKWLLVMVVVLLGAALAFSAIRGQSLFDLLPLALVLLVSAIPVALPAMFTITMALGSMELSKKGVLVTRLSASEDAASMDTLCVDKTGTITHNTLSVVDVVPANGHSQDDIIAYGTLASQEANQDPIDLAFINDAKNRKVDLSGYTVKQFVPFDPATKRTEAVVNFDGHEVRIVKGAVNIISQLCNMDKKTQEQVNDAVNRMANNGYRSLGVGLIDGNKTELLGVVGLYDKPREDSSKLITELRSLGVAVKMLTGDAAPIAKRMASLVGLGDKVAEAPEFRKITDDTKLAEVIEKSDGFAEIYPEDKYKIVKALQLKKHITGMTGDGVNDAPALRQAEVGIAVSNATDVAKGAASVVLTQEGLINIVDLVKIGRMIFQRIVTWIFNKVVKVFQIVVFVVAAFFIWGKFIVGTFDVLLLLFLIDFVTLSISTDHVRWSKNPDRWDVNWLVKVSMVLGVAVVLESLLIEYLGINYFGLLSNLSKLHTFGFDILLVSGMFTIFVVRERGHFWNSRPSNVLLVAIIADIILSSAISIIGIPGLAPIPAIDVLSVIGFSVIFSLIVNDFIKIITLKKLTSK
ncbi:MAG: plasma-membrane proton-efflux P-type ATPase [Nitrososphaerota archaeon]|jgi:H+-transporting ATPase|nr:plasma-membrane proton-efflux P-type ATPase [Nitrososphaerota archaeon]MDG6927019.1 plasma-membrane proton-efflux P-type ATPase [Nitrososphaerota archaeon]MDG6930420.1 plasma-membrane proton-efflux P-type ATPase [Nitrososphaerota archaeon]MDG6931461.1 plasma-membrane proton-efflux P-type ATPase [Nitrososphaerota archaeon]MDG6936434.1 plasma-membrane proton-efflux P-type ATPase [Nitrososphaerota archaeon]